MGPEAIKVLFLDVDGVLNSAHDFKMHRGQEWIMIDPYKALLVYRILEATGAKVVLSSSWRGYPKGEADVVKMIGHELHDRTPRGSEKGHERGYEIQDYLEAHPEIERYAIVDDDRDMLEEQIPHFFKTSWETGLTEETAAAITKHLT